MIDLAHHTPARRRHTFTKPAAIVELIELAAFIQTAMPGESLAYFRGRLDVTIAEEVTDRARDLRDMAFTAGKTGYFDLTQRRLAEDDYLYVIKRCHRRAVAE